MSAVCSFENIQAAVDTTVQVLQCGIPMARIGTKPELHNKVCHVYAIPFYNNRNEHILMLHILVYTSNFSG